MCCSGAQWKREEVPDHKWDFVDVREFHNAGFMSYLQYCFLYVLVIKSVMVYCSDIYTMVLLLASNHWAGSILQNSGGSSAVNVPFSIGKWIFFGCIIFSFLLLAWEAKKSRAIIRSRDISYAFTNVMANNYYSMKSYDHFCFFSQINNSKKKKDDFAFFVFFTFKGWKRLLLADAPRQVINGLTLYSFARSVGFTTDISKWYDGSFAKASVLVSMAFTVVIWIGSFVLLMAAAFLYVPLLCYIQGNLKEYCCHKVDKRIAELMKRKNRKRLAKEAAIMRKEAMGDYSHLKDKKGHFKAAPLPQPTLPKIGFEELISDTKSEMGGAASIRGIPRHGPHAYPPPLGKYAGSASGMGYNPSSKWSTEREYIPEKVGYAESVMSTDRLISHQVPPGGSTYGANVSAYGGEGDPYGQHPLVQGFNPSNYSLNRAPSYSSQDHRQYSDPSYPVAPYAMGPRSLAPSSEYSAYPSEAPGRYHPGNGHQPLDPVDSLDVDHQPHSPHRHPPPVSSGNHPQYTHESSFDDRLHSLDFGQLDASAEECGRQDRSSRHQQPRQEHGIQNQHFPQSHSHGSKHNQDYR